MQLRVATEGAVEIAHPVEWYLEAIKATGVAGNVAAVENQW